MHTRVAHPGVGHMVLLGPPTWCGVGGCGRQLWAVECGGAHPCVVAVAPEAGRRCCLELVGARARIVVGVRAPWDGGHSLVGGGGVCGAVWVVHVIGICKRAKKKLLEFSAVLVLASNYMYVVIS